MNLIQDEIDFAEFESVPEFAKVQPASAFVDGVIDRIAGRSAAAIGAVTPWEKADDLLRFREAEVTCVAGINGHGKSILESQICLHLQRQKISTLIASFEMRPVATMTRMCRQAAGTSNPSDPYIRAFHTWTDSRLWLYAHHGEVRPKRLLAVLRYAQETLGIKHFFIDSLMKCGIASDDYNGQKAFVAQLCDFAMRTSCHVHLVVHARKGQHETDLLDKFDLKGASEIADQVDNIILVHRNKKKEREREKGADETALKGCLIAS